MDSPESKPPAISLPLVDEQSVRLIYLRRNVMGARTGDWESECEAGLGEHQEKRLLVLAFLTLVTTHCTSLMAI